jgi:hypothetical protein
LDSELLVVSEFSRLVSGLFEFLSAEGGLSLRERSVPDMRTNALELLGATPLDSLCRDRAV